ncbi:hypothetical protein Tco_1070110 [Tanacetum coccineum]|uniref:Uncharacterized protein n=1 Tax=Tanacetum coccineum TaxID=301880 RepID=A0ABQ5HKG3_9ASTR
MELLQGATSICEGSCRLTFLERQEVWNDCMSCKVRISSNGNLLWEVSVLLGRKKGEKCTVKFQQRWNSGAKRKLYRCGRIQMGNEDLGIADGSRWFRIIMTREEQGFGSMLEREKVIACTSRNEVKVRWDSKRGPELTWERKDQMRSRELKRNGNVMVVNCQILDEFWRHWIKEFLKGICKRVMTLGELGEVHKTCKENEEMLIDSIENRPFQFKKEITIPGANGAADVKRAQMVADLSPIKKIRYDCDIKTTNIILLGTELTLQEHESKLYDEFDRNSSKMTMTPIQVNTKFVNHLQQEWSRFVTAAKQAKDLLKCNFDQLYAFLKQNKSDAKEVRAMRQRYPDLLSLLVNQIHPPPSYNNSRSH